MKKKNRKNSTKQTFTKLWMNRLLWFCCIWITFSYILASIGYTEIAESLSQTACATIIGTMIPYFLKSFFETKEEKKNELDQMKKQFQSQNDPIKPLENKDFIQSNIDKSTNNDAVG